MKTFNRLARVATFTALALISQAAWAAGSVRSVAVSSDF